MTERFCFNVEDSGEGPLKVRVPSNQVWDFKGLLREMGERSVEVVSLEDDLVAEEVEGNLGPQEQEAVGLTCYIDPGPWNGSACELLTGLDESAMLEELARMEIIMETKRLRDEGGI